tara:strand:- start:1245 stop:1829 length:585 start_codon:yes stop_codon:yes gene_type:complete
MLRKIKLYGHLREYTGLKEVEAHVDNVREAVSFLTCNWPTLESQIVQNNYHVLLDKDDVGEDELLYPIGDASISFIPVVEGSGKFGRIIAGAALIGLTFATGGAFISQAPFKALTFTSNLAKGAFYLGGALLLQGVSDLLTPTPPIPEAEQTPESSAFSSPLNVSMPGIAIPLVYGTAICGSIVVNTSVEIGDV